MIYSYRMRRSVILRTISFLLIILAFLYILYYLNALPSFSLFPYSYSSYRTNSRDMNFIMDGLSGEPLIDPAQLPEDPMDPRAKIHQKIIHLDLKGMPPRISYYETFFPFLKKLGVTGILVEYEDMFPWTGPLQPIANKKSYTKEDIATLNHLAKINGLKVIPLIQTFGHLEFILKLEEFMDLREVPKYPQVICPSNNKTLPLLQEMIDQILSLHPESEQLHIGSDEVYHIGECNLCRSRMDKMSSDNPKIDLFLGHVKLVAEYVVKNYGKRVLMWDDEFRGVDERIIESYGIGKLVGIIIWNYSQDVERKLDDGIWGKYSRLFDFIWIGSAFKGANSPDAMITNETHYLLNHYSWLRVMKNEGASISFQGVILTGWQRYDHFSVLCEILPVSIPSLTACLMFLNTTKSLQPNQVINLALSELSCNYGYCAFPGTEVYQLVTSLFRIKYEFDQIKSRSEYRGWITQQNFQTRFSSPALFEGALNDVIRIKAELHQVEVNLRDELSKIYPSWSVIEWMTLNFYPFSREIHEVYDGLIGLSEQNTWPVRPLPSLTDNRKRPGDN